jgi:hypothetical protein
MSHCQWFTTKRPESLLTADLLPFDEDNLHLAD